MGIEIVKKYFSDFTEKQIEQLEALEVLYRDWNEKINVISRKDIDNLYRNHVLHSLSIAAFTSFTDGSQILDLGTGGGFPGIPLAIFFPEVNFHLIDGTRKKIHVVQEVTEALGLKNVRADQIRAEELKGRKYDFVLSRAVAPLEKLTLWSQPLISAKPANAIPNGLITLKGGDLREELKTLRRGTYYERVPIGEYFPEPYFQDKFLIYIQIP